MHGARPPGSMAIQRHVDKRDGRLEGEPDVEADAASKEKDAQRDLTSLSTPPSPET